VSETHDGAAWNAPEQKGKREYEPFALDNLKDKHEVSIEPGFHFIFIFLGGYWRLVYWGWLPGKNRRRSKRDASKASVSAEDTEVGTRLRIFGAVQKMRGQKSLVLCYQVGDLKRDFALRPSDYIKPWLKDRSSDKSYPASQANPYSFKQPLGGLFPWPNPTIPGKDANRFVIDQAPVFDELTDESSDEPKRSKAVKDADEYAASQVKQALNDDPTYKVAKRVARRFEKYNWPSGEIDPEDLIQEAALAILERSGGFEESGGATLQSFCFTCARTGLLDYWDYMKKTRWFVGFPRGLEELPEYRDTQAHPDPKEDDFNGLPMRQGEAMWGRFVLGKSQAETAARMGISVSAVQKLQDKGIEGMQGDQKEKAA
jgi:RNA polymerase sigma factor (sigma-70 family)